MKQQLSISLSSLKYAYGIPKTDQKKLFHKSEAAFQFSGGSARALPEKEVRMELHTKLFLKNPTITIIASLKLYCRKR